MEDFIWFSIVFLMSVFYLGYLLGKTKFEKFAFGNREEPIYSFKSGDTLEETIKKIEAVVKENALLKKQLIESEMVVFKEGKGDKELESKKFYKEIK